MQVRKLTIVTSCTGEKRFSPAHQLQQDDFDLPERAFEQREGELLDFFCPAEEMYTGQQHLRLMRGVTSLRNNSHYHLNLQIVSAGYGLISAAEIIAPYECTFQTMRQQEIRAWSSRLGIPDDVRTLFKEPSDLILIALGEQYLSALQLDAHVAFGAPVLALTGAESARKLVAIPTIRTIQLSAAETKRFRCGLVGLKGEILRRVLERLAADNSAVWEALLDPSANMLDLLDEPEPERSPKLVAVPRLDKVDFTISTSQAWREQTMRKPLRFFIPDWDDLVDPDYDFEHDRHAGVRGAWSNQVYAHQMFRDNGGRYFPNYDGLLVSRAVADKPAAKRALIRENGGIHRHMRVPSEFPIMGDCGAFSYLLDVAPPYTTDEIVTYYTELGLNYGVSVDHLVFGAQDESGQRMRYELTKHNAYEFLREHRQRGVEWIPIGALQGSAPADYAAAAAEYVKMGYAHLGIGGMVRSRTSEILITARAIREVIPPSVQLHLFGVARLDALTDFIQVGINSVDSASYLRQAWIRMGENYIGHDGLYAAIRVPPYRPSQHLSNIEANTLQSQEQAALGAIRALARGACSVDACLNAVLEYKMVTGTTFSNKIVGQYRATLTNRPWEQCSCAICRAIGVEVIMFRGNNRNRRRGFHNSHAFFNLMQQTIREGRSTYSWKAVTQTDQLPLSLDYQ